MEAEALAIPEEETSVAADEHGPEVPFLTQLSALLFAAGRPVRLQKLAKVLKVSEAAVEDGLEQLRTQFDEMALGFSVEEISGGYQLRTVPQVAEMLRRIIKPRAKRLSRAAGETLAIIAYRQPIERSEIEAIRGVDALPVLKTLLEYKLIRVVGKLDSIGSPSLYGTTEVFLERFGLRDLSELPPLKEFEQILSDPGEPEEEEEEVCDDDFSLEDDDS